MNDFVLVLKKDFKIAEKLHEIPYYLYNEKSWQSKELCEMARCLLENKGLLKLWIKEGKLLSLGTDELVLTDRMEKEILGKEEPRFFFDMDGTLAEWNAHLTYPDEIWEPGYFRDRPLMKGVADILTLLHQKYEQNCYILSACSRMYEHVLQDKTAWLDQHVPFIPEERRLFPERYPKNEVVSFPKANDILIDDFNKNLTEWHGIPVKLLNGINSPWKGYNISCDMEAEKAIHKLETIIHKA